MKNKKLGKKNKKYKGFSLLEMLIAGFIFSLVITTAVSVFSNVFFTGEKTRGVQKNIETARTALDLMAKNMRMSSELGPNNTNTLNIYMFNNSQGECIGYRFNSGALEMAQMENPTSGSTDCSGVFGAGDYTSITEGNVSGRFYVISTSNVDPKRVGKATARMEIDGQYLQTTVSFRDYLGVIY